MTDIADWEIMGMVESGKRQIMGTVRQWNINGRELDIADNGELIDKVEI